LDLSELTDDESGTEENAAHLSKTFGSIDFLPITFWCNKICLLEKKLAENVSASAAKSIKKKLLEQFSCRLAWVPPGNLLFPFSEAKNGLINCEKE